MLPATLLDLPFQFNALELMCTHSLNASVLCSVKGNWLAWIYIFSNMVLHHIRLLICDGIGIQDFSNVGMEVRVL